MGSLEGKNHNFGVLMAASASSGIVARSIFHPIDTMKARLQVLYSATNFEILLRRSFVLNVLPIYVDPNYQREVR